MMNVSAFSGDPPKRKNYMDFDAPLKRIMMIMMLIILVIVI